MSKHIFSLLGLCVLALAYPAGRATANPTEDADRQFLANLEKGAATQTAPATAAAPLPAMRTTRPQSISDAPIPKAIAVVKRAPQKVPKQVAREHLQQLPEVADGDLQIATAPTSVTKVVIIKTNDPDADREEDGHHHFFHRLFSHLLSNHPEDW